MDENNIINKLGNLNIGYKLTVNFSDKFDTQGIITAFKDSKYDIIIKTKNNKIELNKFNLIKNQKGYWEITVYSKIHAKGILMAIKQLILKQEKIKQHNNKSTIIQKIEKLVAEMKEKAAKSEH